MMKGKALSERLNKEYGRLDIVAHA